MSENHIDYASPQTNAPDRPIAQCSLSVSLLSVSGLLFAIGFSVLLFESMHDLFSNILAIGLGTPLLICECAIGYQIYVQITNGEKHRDRELKWLLAVFSIVSILLPLVTIVVCFLAPKYGSIL